MQDFELFQWKDHITDGDQTYTMQPVPGQPDHYYLVPDPITVIQQGTPLGTGRIYGS